MEQVQCRVTSISQAQALRELASFRFVDPSGSATLKACIETSHCFAVESKQGRIVFALHIMERLAWVNVAGGLTSCPMSPTLNAALVDAARSFGCSHLGFQTARRGLVRVASSLGWYVARSLPRGWELERAVPHDS